MGILSLIISLGMVFLSFYSYGIKTAIPAITFFVFFLFLIIPVIKNQVVDVKNNGIIVYNFGKSFELRFENLLEVVFRKRGAISYRFQKGAYHFQITPFAYYDGELLQAKFESLFKRDWCHILNCE